MMSDSWKKNRRKPTAQSEMFKKKKLLDKSFQSFLDFRQLCSSLWNIPYFAVNLKNKNSLKF